MGRAMGRAWPLRCIRRNYKHLHTFLRSHVPTFREPTTSEKIFNRIFGFHVGLGVGFSYNYLLEVRGRKTGKLCSIPINLLERNGRRYLVAPRGRTRWVRNAQAAREITLKRGSKRECSAAVPSPRARRQTRSRNCRRVIQGSNCRPADSCVLPIAAQMSFKKNNFSSCIKLKVMASSNIPK
jgi:hypothetical protein